MDKCKLMAVAMQPMQTLFVSRWLEEIGKAFMLGP